MRWDAPPATLVAPGDESDPRFVLEILDECSRLQRDEAIVEIRFYLLEKGEADPWAYAVYHCSTAANVYSRIHWAHYPAGYVTDQPPEMSQVMRRRFIEAGRISR